MNRPTEMFDPKFDDQRPAWKAAASFAAFHGPQFLLAARSFALLSLAMLCHCAAGIDNSRAAQKPAGDASASISAPAVKPASKDSILFRNGDTFYGRLKSIELQGGVQWASPDALEVIEFLPEAVSEIQLGDRPSPVMATTNSCQIHFTNQDVLEGNLVLCDNDKVVLETWYAGKMTIPRRMVQFILPRTPPNPPLFEGPSGMEGWTMGKVAATAVANAGEWRYRDGAFYANQSASIARDLKLPDVASIQFEIAWKEVLHMAVALYTDYLQPISLQSKETEPDFGGFYSLQISSYAVNLLPITKNDPIRYLGPVPVPVLSQKNKAQIEIRVNKPKRIIALLVDGTLVKQWIDTEDFVGKGTGLRFVHQGQGAIKLNKLRISEWDGQFEETPSPNPNGKQDIAKLANGDKVMGDVLNVSDSKMTFFVTGSKLEIPMNRVKLVEFAAQKTDRAPEEKTDVKAWFHHGGSVTFRLEKWDDEAVVGSSPNFGAIVFNPAAFRRVRFNSNPFFKRTVSLSVGMPRLVRN
jgi:hypothetical protein